MVLPLYNEERVLRTLERSVTEAIRDCGCRPEIIFVNDGSRDGSPEILDELAAVHSHVRVLHLSRNFGHQAALQAGLEHAFGDAIVVMDADLQDDPAGIPRLLPAKTTASGRVTRRASSDPACFSHSGQGLARLSHDIG